MIVFLNEEHSYLSWIAHHHEGYVLDWRRQPTRQKPLVHRAQCDEIRHAKTKRTHWTTGHHLKACSLDLKELLSWAEQMGGKPVNCAVCAPTDNAVAAAQRQQPLTRLGKKIVDCVVERAVIHLDRGDQDYHVTVGEVAQALGKTPGQITSALRRLETDGYLRVPGDTGTGALTARLSVFPAPVAMRTLPAFEKMSKDRIQAELDQLTALQTSPRRQANHD